jgi:Rubrerythrin.
MSTIWQLAKLIEMEGKKMYEALALSAPKRELAGAFSALAEEEQGHYEIFDSLEKDLPLETSARGPESVEVSRMFDALRTEFLTDETALVAMNGAENVYYKALALENRSRNLYNEMLEELTDEHQKRIVRVIIDEENRHIKIIHGLIDFVHRPKEWLEDAEVYHLDEY